MSLPYAHEVNYWKTGSTQPDTLLDRAEKLIAEVGGEVTHRASMRQYGREVIVLCFVLAARDYRIAWPVLPVRGTDSRDQAAARRQGATFIYHDVKAKCMVAKVLGVEAAFMPYLLTSEGKTFSELTSSEAAKSTHLLPAPSKD